MRVLGAMARRLVAVMVLCTLVPGASFAAPARPSVPPPELVAFDAGFNEGQDLFNHGEFLAAVRKWTEAAELLPENNQYKNNRIAIYEYIADTYVSMIKNGAGEAVVREGRTTLERYATDFSAVHPGEALPGPVEDALIMFGGIIESAETTAATAAAAAAETAAAEAVAKHDAELARARALLVRPKPPPPKPVMGLAVGGGLALGGGAAMLAMLGVGAARARASEAYVENPDMGCFKDQALTGECLANANRGKTANSVQIAGLVLAPILVAAGVALLVVAGRRKAKNRTLAPLFAPRMAGLSFQANF